MGNSKNDYSFTGCVVEKVDSPLGGGLVEGMRSGYHHFFAWNSSYFQCIRRDNADPVIGNKTMKSQVVDSGDATFVDCDFNNLSTENSSRVNGGAILFTSSGLINVTLCKFYSCYCTWCGGAISSRTGGKNFEITSSKFDSGAAEASSGCIDFFFVSTFSMKNTNCSNSSTKHIGGGILIEHNEYQGIIENCHFYCCRKNTTEFSGGGSVGLFDNGTAVISDCSFCGGFSENNGAGVCWNHATGINDSPTLFCFFSNNTAVNPGHDVYVVEGWTNINENSFVHCRSSTSANSNRVVKGSTEYNNWIPKIHFNPVFVNSMEGLDHMACGFVRAGDEYGRRCKTIEYGMSVLDTDGSSNEVIIEVGDYEENKVEVGKMKISFDGKDKTQVIVHNRSPNGESLVAIGTGMGSFRNMTFVCGENPSSHLMEVLAEEGVLNMCECVITSLTNDEKRVLSASLMIIQMGSIIFDSVEISGISFSSVSAFEIRGEHSLSFQMKGVEVNGISRMSGDGSVICGSLVYGMKMNISGGMMRNCECEDGCGGGMWIQLNEGSQMEIGNISSESGDENVDNVTFSNCSCVGKGNGVGGYGGAVYLDVVDEGCSFCIYCASFESCQAEKGNNIFVNAQCLRDVVNKATFGFECEGMIDSDLLGYEDGCREECAPLLPFLMEAGDVGFVGGEKSLDFSRCGMERYPCSSIKKVVGVWYGDETRTIRIKNGFVLREEIVMERHFWNVTGSIGDTAVNVVVPSPLFDSDCLICISSGALLKDMCFSLPSTLSLASSFVLSSSNVLSVCDCSVEPFAGNFPNEIEYCVFHIDGGELHMTGFSNKGPINTLSNSIIKCTGDGIAELSNCVLTGITRRTGGGSCLERIREESESESEDGDVSVVVIIVVSGCTFSECGVEEKDGCGGGMKISIGKDEEVVINGSTTFDSCKAENEADSNGRGGGIMIAVGNGGSLKMKEVKFEGCEVSSGEGESGAQGLGGGMFVELPNQMGLFVLEGMEFEGCNAWKGKNVFISGWDLNVIVNDDHFKWEMSPQELGSLDELCGWERKATGEGYVIPLVVYLWSNWSEKGYVSKEKGGDFSGCGYSEAPCSSINHLISLRYGTLGRSESHVIIVEFVILQNSLHLIQTDSDTPKISIEGEENGTVLRVEEENEEEMEEAMVASEVILSFMNVSFVLLNVLVHHLAFIKSSSGGGALFVRSCSFVSEDASKETNFCLVMVDGGRVAIEDCAMKEFHLLQGFMELSSDVKVADVMNLSISDTSVSGRSLISISESALLSERSLKEATLLRNKENVDEDGVMLLSINSSTFTNITCSENRATIVSAGSFECGMRCLMEGCVMTKCLSEWSEEGGGMKVSLKSRESELRVSGCMFGMCSCSVVKGRGGGLMIDASGLDGAQTETEDAPPLGIMIERTRFTMNDAYVGKDVFIRCNRIEKQINEKLFSLDFSQESLKSNNSICGSDEEKTDIDLIPLITFYYGQQVFVNANGRDMRQCGEQMNPCKSISCSVDHIQKAIMNVIFIDEEGDIGGECVIGDLNVKSIKKMKATVHFNATIQEMGNEGSVIVFVNECVVERCVFEFGELHEANHRYIMKVKNGTTMMRECECLSSTTELIISSTIMAVEGGELEMDKCAFTRMKLCVPLIEFVGGSEATISETRIDNLESEGNVIEVGNRARVEMKMLDIQNIALSRSGSVVKMQNVVKNVILLNCSFGKCLSPKEKGSIVSVDNCVDVGFDSCSFLGGFEDETREEWGGNGRMEEICKWNGSVVDVQSSNALMKDTTISNLKKGGLSLSGGSVEIEKGEFMNNNPSIANYVSARRNVLCESSAKLKVTSLKGGDGVLPNTSLWILNEGCTLEGIAGERASAFFIPRVESVSSEKSGEVVDVVFRGSVLLPCNLSFKTVAAIGDEEVVEKYSFDESGFISEEEVHGSVPVKTVEGVASEAEVSVHILFGSADKPSSTDSFVLKNKSATEPKDDGNLVEGGKEGKSSWALIVIVIFAVLFVIALIGFIIFVVRWRKQKRRTKELEIIVEDTVKKDPKLIEMVTMEMSPEEQWRRAEREAEKKNEENAKRRMCGKKMAHSESEEYLLSESGSTEYILGKDSDKIPEWALEKVEEKEIEEEETRKRSPSPSISSTSTTDTSDTDTTFVRSESLCPTTSSMSNLVDAMACSSPHEKLIVDLRDSLFMLLHGRNEKKEMAIGTLQEREQTASQIMFWVANGALHSFEDEEDELPSLSNLSPHIVLLSEHMVICIALHSDFSSDDSDSSSISSTTIVTSASDGNEEEKEDYLPSSAFEDDKDNKNECLRWKAPELLMNKKMKATQKSVVFSIGMMLWECLTLQIPFGEYDAETAGDKIANGERPDVQRMRSGKFEEVARRCLLSAGEDRPSVVDFRREMFVRMPGAAMMITQSDAIYESFEGLKGDNKTSDRDNDTIDESNIMIESTGTESLSGK